MIVVLDTNCLVASLPHQSPYRPVYDAIRNGTVTLAVTTEILGEYEEILERIYGADLAGAVVAQLLMLPNTILATVYFKWQLIAADPDDDKFVDCYVASLSECLVTEDRHFNSVKTLAFPKIRVVGMAAFLKLIS